MAAHGVASRMVWLWLWPRRLIVVHDAFASRGVAEEQIAFFGVAQARVGVLSAEVSAVARRLARARHASIDALTDVMVAVVVLAIFKAYWYVIGREANIHARTIFLRFLVHHDLQQHSVEEFFLQILVDGSQADRKGKKSHYLQKWSSILQEVHLLRITWRCHRPRSRPRI